MKIALIGYGKMGKTIEKLAIEEGHEIVLKINQNTISELNVENLRKADVAFEFSTPQTVVQNILLCFDAGTPVVVGTTAWYDHKHTIEETCNITGGTMLAASNFSLGVNIFSAINKKLADIMSHHRQYKVSIEEIHHTAKLDAPSGTAITLAEEIIQHHTAYKNWENNVSTNDNVISIESVREPDVPGTHVIKYVSAQDSIELKHTAINRDGFASGAILAAQWIIGKKGIYTMKDVLNL